jgi:hypothetical protein
VYKSKRKPSIFHMKKKVHFNTFVDAKIVNLAFLGSKELNYGILKTALCPRFALESELTL